MASPTITDKLQQIFDHVDSHRDAYIDRLRDAVRIPSVSGEPDRRKEVIRMVEWTKKLLESTGAICELKDLGQQHSPTGVLPLPPVLIGQLGNDPKKQTLLVYGHLDVQPAKKEDGWNTEPFELVEKDGKMFGRGSSDDKGPVLSWINAIEAYQKVGQHVPINIKFVFEGMEESGSEGLDDLLSRLKGEGWLNDVDYVCISDSYWLGKNKPCISYGLRGISYYFVEVQGSRMDLHSGCFGGSVYEPMSDLVWILGQLTTLDGRLLIPGLYEMVAPITDQEKKLYDTIDFDLEQYRSDIGALKLAKGSKQDTLQHLWRYPSLSIHGVEGAFSGSGAKTVIPKRVIGKFSIRLVSDMDPKKTDQLVFKYVEDVFKKRNSGNRLSVKTSHEPSKPWVADFNHPHYQAGAKAVKRVFGMEPDFIREGCSIPVTLTFQELTGKSVMLLPIGASDDMAHSQNEKMNVVNYVNGAKLLAAYFHEISQL